MNRYVIAPIIAIPSTIIFTIGFLGTFSYILMGMPLILFIFTLTDSNATSNDLLLSTVWVLSPIIFITVILIDEHIQKTKGIYSALSDYLMDILMPLALAEVAIGGVIYGLYYRFFVL